MKFLAGNLVFLCRPLAVLMAELFKLFSCIWLVFREEGSAAKLTKALHSTIVQQPIDTMKVCVPSLVYVVQNNLLYVAASHLDAATYQVCHYICGIASGCSDLNHVERFCR